MTDAPATDDALRRAVRGHFRFGWMALLVFVTLGTTLELLHAFKAEAYLGVGSETRRLMWTLSHAHGIGLSLLHMLYAATLGALFESVTQQLALASRFFTWSSMLIPAGFFLGGVVTYGGDPGVGVFLVPLGAALLWMAVALVAYEIVRTKA